MRRLINYKLLLLCPFLLAACSNEDETPSIPPANQPDAVELGITAGVTLTKSAVTSDANLTGGIAVYAGLTGATSGTDTDPYTSTLRNNYAIYTESGSSWSNSSATDKIYLTSQEATVFAHYPAYKPTASGNDKGALQTSGTALKATESDSKVSSASTIDVTVFPGHTDINTLNYLNPATSNANKTWQTDSWKENSNKNAIISAPGEVDYMWGSNTADASLPTVSNGKQASGNPATDAHKAALKMNHALAMVSFRIYNDGTYKNTGNLTKIQLKNVNGTGLNDGGTTPKMKISDGVITAGTTPQVVTYTRFIDDNGSGTPSGYTLIKIGTTDAAGVVSSTAGGTTSGGKDEAAAASAKFSIMVLPIAAASTVSASSVQAIFTIDGAEYAVPLGSSGNITWEKGQNYSYTAKLSGKELSITSVTVADWTPAVGNNGLEVN